MKFVFVETVLHRFRYSRLKKLKPKFFQCFLISGARFSRQKRDHPLALVNLKVLAALAPGLRLIYAVVEFLHFLKSQPVPSWINITPYPTGGEEQDDEHHVHDAACALAALNHRVEVWLEIAYWFQG